MSRPFLAFALSLAVAVPLVLADEESPWLGRRVMPRAGCKYYVADREVDPPLDLYLPYQVVAVTGGWLDIGPARVRKGDVVPLEEAEAYYTGLIRKSPREAWHYNFRGMAHQFANRWEEALADYDWSIRLDPDDPGTYCNRGSAREALGDPRGAIADFTLSLRKGDRTSLTPRLRGSTWMRLGDGHKAYNDVTDAVERAPADLSSH